MRLRLAMLPLLAFAAPATSLAGQGGVSVSGQWIRALAAGTPAAGYFTLRNDGGEPRVLVGASSPACGSLTLHQTVRQHAMSAMSANDPSNPGNGMAAMPGMSMMQEVPAVTVPAHGAVRFAPGSYHLMCERPGAAVRPGQEVGVTLRLKGGDSVTSAFPVRDARGG